MVKKWSKPDVKGTKGITEAKQGPREKEKRMTITTTYIQ